MKKRLFAALAFAVLMGVAPRPAAAHFSISLGIPLPIPVGPPPCAPYAYSPYPYAPYYGYPYAAPYPTPYVDFSYGGFYGPHRFGQPRYFDGWRDGGYRRPRARGYTFH